MGKGTEVGSVSGTDLCVRDVTSPKAMSSGVVQGRLSVSEGICDISLGSLVGCIVFLSDHIKVKIIITVFVSG